MVASSSTILAVSRAASASPLAEVLEELEEVVSWRSWRRRCLGYINQRTCWQRASQIQQVRSLTLPG